MSGSLGRAHSMGRALSFEQLAVSSTAVGLTVPAAATSALLSTDTDTVRFRMDGSDPTAAVGHLLPTNTFLEIYRDDLAHAKFIRVTTDTTLFVTYYGG